MNTEKELKDMMETMEVDPSKKHNVSSFNLKRKSPSRFQMAEGELPRKLRCLTIPKGHDDGRGFIKDLKAAENLSKKEAKISVINTVFFLLEFSPNRMIMKKPDDNIIPKSSYEVNDDYLDSDEEDIQERKVRYKGYSKKLTTYIDDDEINDMDEKVTDTLKSINRMIYFDERPSNVLPRELLELELKRKTLKYEHMKEKNKNIPEHLIPYRDKLITSNTLKSKKHVQSLLNGKDEKRKWRERRNKMES